MKNILEYLEITATTHPEKKAFIGANNELTFVKIFEGAKRIGSYIADKLKVVNKPIIVITEQNPDDITAMMGVVYSGNFYVPVDADTPSERLKTMVETISPVAVLLKSRNEHLRALLDGNVELILFENAISAEINDVQLDRIRKDMTENDPLFAIFTSGSTGVPKCIVKSHRAMMSFIDTFTELFGINESTVFGNQSPFYFDASTKDIYSTLKCAAQTVIIPKPYFMFPSQAIKLMNDMQINTIVWVPSVMGTVSIFNVFEEITPEHLKKVFFVGEVMPVKHLNYWIKHLPEVSFVNLYGTTEAAGNCLYYEINTDTDVITPIPLGKTFPNTKVFLLNDKNEIDDYGEICISGPTIALGYYKKPDTQERFCQNPTNSSYYERICRTGDYARIRNDGLLEFVSRADFQIKHMGNRIELGDIESAALEIDNVSSCCCVYVKDKDTIVLFFTSDLLDRKQLKRLLKEKLPTYMLPNKVIQLDQLPSNANGKIDRKALLDNATN